MTPELVDTPAALAALCDDLTAHDCIAVDTEFVRERTYFPHIGLIQIASDRRIACIDPLAFDARPSLAGLLYDPSITKVFHACLQDIEVIKLNLGEIPCPLFDTQLALALMDEDHQVSYARLVESKLGVTIPKSETRTDWLKRPLTAAQLEYAADDVRYLLPLYRQQQEELEALDRTGWMQEECDRLCAGNQAGSNELNHCWTRVRGKERLSGLELAVLQQVAAWREQRAMARDRTRRRILPDDLVIEIAVKQPKNASALASIGRIGKLLGMPELDSLSEAVRDACRTPEDAWPSLKRRHLTQEQSKALDVVLKMLRQKASEYGVSQGVLCNRKDAEKLVLGARDLPVLRGWRRELIGDELLRRISSALS